MADSIVPDPNEKQTPPAPDTPKASWIWLKDTSGYPSATVTFVTVAFWVTTLWFIMSIVHKVGPIEIRQFDSTAATTYLSPLLALYFGRRWTDAKLGNQNNSNSGNGNK